MTHLSLLEVSERLRQSDLQQATIGYLAVLAFVLLVVWPASEGPNDSFQALAQTNALALTLLSLAFGSMARGTTDPSRQATLVALLCTALLASPLVVASYAASFPTVPLAWALVGPLGYVVAYYGVGLVLGAAFRAARIGFLLPLAVPGLVALLIVVDVWLGRALFNPLTHVTTLSLTHLLTIALLALATFGYLFYDAVRKHPQGANA